MDDTVVAGRSANSNPHLKSLPFRLGGDSFSKERSINVPAGSIQNLPSRPRREAVTGNRGQNSTRAAILDAMTAEDRPVSARELARSLSQQPATVKYHLAVLRDEGRVEVDHVDYLSSHVEHYYRPTGKEEEER